VCQELLTMISNLVVAAEGAQQEVDVRIFT
jgi:hypothetical protein